MIFPPDLPDSIECILWIYNKITEIIPHIVNLKAWIRMESGMAHRMDALSPDSALQKQRTRHNSIPAEAVIANLAKSYLDWFPPGFERKETLVLQTLSPLKIDRNFSRWLAEEL
jgi:hypothetical protein